MTSLALLGLVLIAGGSGGGDDDAPKAPPAIEVHVRADAEIRGTEVLLRDLAEVQTDDLELTARLLQVSFGPRPAFGYNRVLSRQDLLLRLAREGLAAERLHFTGAGQVVLHPLVTRITQQELLAASDPVLRAALDLEGGDIEFEPAARLPNIDAPPGRLSFDLSARLMAGRLGYSTATVAVSVLVDGEEWKQVPVPYRLHRYQSVLVTSAVVRRGAALGEDNVALQRIEAPQGTSPNLQSLDAIRGKVAARDLQAGQRLTLDSITDPAVMFEGDLITLVATGGRVQVAIKAIALKDGAVGDRIPVRNLTSGNVLPATVRSRALAVVVTAAGVQR